VISFIFQITPETVKLLMSVDSTTRQKHMSYSLDTVAVPAVDRFVAAAIADGIRQDRLAFMQRIAENPIQSIGQLG
jgi:hypothetical protein